MKHYFLYIVCCISLIACQEDGSCLKSAGKAAEKSILVNSFKNIKIDAGLSVEIIPDDVYKVEIFSYENRIDHIDAVVANEELILTNNNNCNLIHRYKAATIKVYTPTLEKIFSNTQFEVYSEKVLTYPELYLISSMSEKNASSSYRFKIDNQKLIIEDNQIAYYQLSGKTRLFNARLYGGNGRVEAQNLIADDVEIFHRSNNDMLLKPLNSLKGTLYATGNVILYSNPKEVYVVQKYTGKIIIYNK